MCSRCQKLATLSGYLGKIVPLGYLQYFWSNGHFPGASQKCKVEKLEKVGKFIEVKINFFKK